MGGERGWRGGGCGRGRGRGRGAHYSAAGGHMDKKTRTMPGTAGDLAAWLHARNGAPYGAYHDIEGEWEFPEFTFILDRAQADPYASPSKARVRIAHADAKFPAALRDSPIRRTALADFLLRRLYAVCCERQYNAKMQGGGWSGAKGGQLEVDVPGQQVLERTAVIISDTCIEMRFAVGLPAQGRSIMGDLAAELLCEHVAELVHQGLLYTSYDADAMKAHVDTVEDQDVLRSKMAEAGLCAFVPNGARMARQSGESDLPLAGCVPFTSPPSLQVEMSVPHRGLVRGMGLRQGHLVVCIGGGFHGKSTFLSALALGSYNFVPGDGREFVCTSADVASVRTEDGRSVQQVDISTFIRHLPTGADTTAFCTPNASGSTSCAAAFAEATELGAPLILMDEDSTASNFLDRDAAMQRLVPNEPIQPFVMSVREAVQAHNRSFVLVCGSSSAFLPEADVVLQMEKYEMKDVTAEARRVCEEMGVRPMRAADALRSGATRRIHLPLPSVRGAAQSTHVIRYGDTLLELGAIPHIVHKSQTRAIYAQLERWMHGKPAAVPLPTALDDVETAIREHGLDVLRGGAPDGFFARPRRMDMGMALNRLRNAKWSR